MRYLNDSVFSGNAETKLVSERKNPTLPNALKIGLGAAIFISPAATIHSELGTGNSNISVVSSAHSTYNVRTTVYTEKYLSEEAEAIQVMDKERRETVKVHLHNVGYEKHSLEFSDYDEIYEDGDFELINPSNDSIPVKAVISKSGYEGHKLFFDDEVNA
ncbi:hypothetical protein [Paenibacillus woosongensis]|uniref:Uncharacterized protein n=1 Tax=Paenibacillus woosongensis TaxID=307580 RepID=A0ABQ4MRV8_9BACL|nr:hypothetical protein [Paenibacillus woosongensis]GIP58679.1 hypothetical protein J15TS10_24930 [Paenibacillus woosongensis]